MSNGKEQLVTCTDCSFSYENCDRHCWPTILLIFSNHFIPIVLLKKAALFFEQAFQRMIIIPSEGEGFSSFDCVLSRMGSVLKIGRRASGVGRRERGIFIGSLCLLGMGV